MGHGFRSYVKLPERVSRLTMIKCWVYGNYNWIGLWLVVYPKNRLVFVRLVRIHMDQ